MSNRTKFQALPQRNIYIPAYRLAERIFWFQISHGEDVDFWEVYDRVYELMTSGLASV